LRKRRLGQLRGALLLAVAAVAVAIALTGGGIGGRSQIRLQRGEAVPGQTFIAQLFAGIPEHGNALGNPSAPVTLQEFADLQCPYCRAYAQDALPGLVTRYVRGGRVRMVFEDLAFIGADSRRAGLFAAAAGQQGRLWPLIELLYENQGVENTGFVSDAFLTRIGVAAGVDAGRALADRAAPAAAAALDDAHRLAAAQGISSTPTFRLGRTGGRLTSLQPSNFTTGDFTGPIDRALGSTR
jgi:protein-disulfide isomerase